MKTFLTIFLMMFATIAYSDESDKYLISDGHARYESVIIDDRVALRITGLISQNFSQFVFMTFDKIKPDLIILNSQGGMMNEMMPVANFIHRKNIPIHIEDVCLSACAYMLLFSSNVTISENAQVGFHTPFFPLVPTNKTVEQLQREYSIMQFRLAIQLYEVGIPMSFSQFLLVHTDLETFAFLTDVNGIDTIRNGEYLSLEIRPYFR